MKTLLRVFNFLAIAFFCLLLGEDLNAQNICVSGNTIIPSAIQNYCVGTTPSNLLTAAITTSGSGSNGNITYTWYSSTTNNNTGGTVVQTLATSTTSITNTFTPPTTNAGVLWYYCTVSNDGGDCAGTSFTTSAVQVNVNTLPKIFNVTGGGTRCNNGGGLSIVLNGSENGMNYQLYRDGSPAGVSRSGTGTNLVSLVNNAGNYTMVATSATTGCATNMNGSALVRVNPIPDATYSKTDISCQGSDGSITVTGNGGTPGYLFNIDGGSFSDNSIFMGLLSGNHTVSVKDANSCVVSIPNITISNAGPLSVKINQVNPGNCTGTDGSITVSRVGGVDDGITPVQFKLDGDATRPYQISNVFGNLSKGSYTVTIKDSKGCTGVSSTVTLTQNAGTSPTVYNVTGGGTRCSNGAGVSIYLSGSQTGVNYQLQRDGGPVGSVLPGTGSPLSFFLSNAGSYKIVATNAIAGCTSDMNGMATITVNPAPTVFNVTGGGNRCSNGPGVPIYLSGSQTGVNYQLQKGGLPVGSSLSGTGSKITFVVANAGTYSIVAKNTTTNCTLAMNGSSTVIVNESPYVYNVTGGGILCSTNSSISVQLSGSQTGVNYQLNANGVPVGSAISGDGSSISFVASDADTYKILATNNTSGCITFMSGTAVVNQNPPLTPSYTKYYASECVGNDGTITVTGKGGTPGYMFSIDNGIFSSNNYFTGLAAGDHKIIVTDANSCSFTYDAITVLTAPPIQVSATTTNLGSCSDNDGSITAHYYGGVVDGITPLQYKLDGAISRPFQTSNVFDGLPVGDYIVTQKDSKGCTGESSAVTLAKAAALTVVPSGTYQTNISVCGNGSDGNIVITVTGGVLPYKVTLNGIEYSTDLRTFGFGNLGVGNYSVIITDFRGCILPLSYTLTQAGAPITKVSYWGNETCIGKNNGYISLAPNNIGGIPPQYKYSKDGGATYQSGYSFTSLGPGTYNMVVKDSKGCVSTPVSVTIKPGIVSCREANTDGNRIGRIEGNNHLSKTSLSSTELSVQTYPNPYGSEFTLDVKGSSQEKISIIMTDIAGRRIYQAHGTANRQYKLGGDLKKGIYILQVMQADNIQTIKIVKE